MDANEKADRDSRRDGSNLNMKTNQDLQKLLTDEAKRWSQIQDNAKTQDSVNVACTLSCLFYSLARVASEFEFPQPDGGIDAHELMERQINENK